MKQETILWAVKIGEPDYCEQIITTDANKIEAAKVWASLNGFDRFRISVIDLNTQPNFINTIN